MEVNGAEGRKDHDSATAGTDGTVATTLCDKPEQRVT
jgi:hypothetical protein